MLRELKRLPDFAKTFDRFEAWWHREIIDRPLITLSLKQTRPIDFPGREHATQRERWLDVEFQVRRAIAWLESIDFAADAFPVLLPNVGPELVATLLGCELDFSEFSSWSKPIIHDPSQWHEIVNRPLNFDNIYWQTIERMTDLALELCDGRYVVGIADLHDNYDLLAGLRDPQLLCEDLMDCPQTIERVGRLTTRVFVESFNRLWSKIRSEGAAGHPCTTWTPMLHDGPAYLPCCDFWCMVSDQIAKDLILPDILAEMRALDRTLFHLDGPQALRHLDLLLEIPQLNGIQWVYGDGHGPATKWIDTYKRILDAGKCVQVLAADFRDAMNVFEAVGGRGVWITIYAGCSRAEADAFLKDAARFTR